MSSEEQMKAGEIISGIRIKYDRLRKDFDKVKNPAKSELDSFLKKVQELKTELEKAQKLVSLPKDLKYHTDQIGSLLIKIEKGSDLTSSVGEHLKELKDIFLYLGQLKKDTDLLKSDIEEFEIDVHFTKGDKSAASSLNADSILASVVRRASQNQHL